MLQIRTLLALGISAWSLGWLSVARAVPPGSIVGWGDVVDPDGDCKFAVKGKALKIVVPGTIHDLTAETGDMSAPRVLRDVEGDFILQVKVGGEVTHHGGRVSKTYLAYHGAGLLIWIDDKTYIRLERAMVVQEDEDVHYINLGLRKDGDVEEQNRIFPDQSVFLRLERHGGRVVGAVSPDGVRWSLLHSFEVALPERLKVGVVAVNTSTEPLTADFEDFEVFRKDQSRENP
jgi:regulation of enolase protein 1 (concanavalin A-like superfamily)